MARKRRKDRRPEAGGGTPAVPPAPPSRLPGPPASPPPGPPGPPRRRRVPGWVWALAAAVLVPGGILLLRAIGGEDESPAPRIALPPPPAASPPAGPAYGDFVGAEACATCHPAQFGAWKASTHGRAGGEPAPEVVIAPFDGTPMRFKDAVVTPRARGGRYTFAVARPGEPERILTVDGVVGGGHMVGGGTQGFLSRHPDGTVRFLPFDWSRTTGVWFCNTNTRADRGWLPIKPDLALADCGDWPPIRVFGDEPRFSNCQQCHGSQILIRFDRDARRYDTRYTSLGVNCESCHGPGRRHVELARSGGLAGSADIGLRSLTTLGVDESLGVCFQCHAVKDALAAGYLPGRSLEAHYSIRLPLLGDSPLFPDGRIRSFAYQENHLYSDCYLSGSMTCVDCHEPHGQGYQDLDRRPLESRFSDGQCLGCHAAKADRIEEHTHHPAGSEGSRCVACHMPYLQEPELGHAVRYARSDHTIPVPRPAFDAALGIAVACQSCHRDRSAARLQAETERWWGKLKPHPPVVAALADSIEDGDEAARRLLVPEGRHAMARFAGLARYFERFLEPDMDRLDGDVVRKLRTLAGSPDLDLQALALAGLHLARGERPDTRAFLAATLRGLGERDGPVRARWATALGFRADGYRNAGEHARAAVVYRKAIELQPGDPRFPLNLGLAYRAAGNPASAVEWYRESLRLDPDQPLAHVNLGSALDALGDADGAIAAYRQALEIDPREALAHVNLGNLHLRRDRPAEAAEHYERALAIDESLAPASFYLARSYLALGRDADALRAVRRGLAFQPANTDARRLLQHLESRRQGQ